MSEKIDDGGPAFPCGSVNRLSVGTSDPLSPGMTLRDYFAATARTEDLCLANTVKECAEYLGITIEEYRKKN